METIRKLLTITAILFFVLPAAATRADEHSDALKKAKTENKPVLLYFYSNYCTYCEAMDRNVLSDKDIKKSLATDVVYLRINVDDKRETAARYNIRGYPTTYLLDPVGKRIAVIPGYMSKRDFGKVLAFLKGKYYRTTNIWDFVS
jgi:thioredoxin-related protein